MQNQGRSHLSKDDFLDWKNNGITHQFFQAILDRIQDLKDGLAGSAGQDSSQDRYVCGMIRAFGEVLNVEVNDIIIEEGEQKNA